MGKARKNAILRGCRVPALRTDSCSGVRCLHKAKNEKEEQEETWRRERRSKREARELIKTPRIAEASKQGATQSRRDLQVRRIFASTVAQTGEKVLGRKIVAVENASRPFVDSPRRVCPRALCVRYTNERPRRPVRVVHLFSKLSQGENAGGERLRDTRGWRMCTQCDWCCAPVHSADCRHENSRIFPTTHVHTAEDAAYQPTSHRAAS